MKYIKTYENKNIEQKNIYVKLLKHLFFFFKKLGYSSISYSNSNPTYQDPLLMNKSVEFKLNGKYIFSIFLKETVAGNYYFRYTRTSIEIENNIILDNFMDFMESIDGIDVYIKKNEEFYFNIKDYDIKEIINKIDIENFETFINIKKYNL